ncbi:MAG: hypothetical protein ACE144_06240, partial [Thermodesulfobacteriota bacterium]
AHRAGLPGKEISFLLCPLTRLQGGACGALAGQPVTVRPTGIGLKLTVMVVAKPVQSTLRET